MVIRLVVIYLKQSILAMLAVDSRCPTPRPRLEQKPIKFAQNPMEICVSVCLCAL